EWAAVESKDKSFHAFNTTANWGTQAGFTYLVPAGKTLYITQISASLAFQAQPAAATIEALVVVMQSTDRGVILNEGGAQGVATQFPRPEKFEAGDTFQLDAYNMGDRQLILTVSAGGYEV
ncbi:MAG: hypothetical protein PHQ43_11630, partial [Dehalococcoidales bacterium]|nr:hypothetical protein [Dehalococcoidales bacterium]